jgi:hypothetical protein
MSFSIGLGFGNAAHSSRGFTIVELQRPALSLAFAVKVEHEANKKQPE